MFPMYMTVTLMIFIGLFPSLFIGALSKPVNLFTHHIVFNLNFIRVGAIDSLQIINWLFVGFIGLVLILFGFRKYITRGKVIEKGPTWGCGYSRPGSKLQYTANSFVRSYSKLAKPLLDIEKKEVEIDDVFPSDMHYESDSYDKIERKFIDNPIKLLNKITDLFLFLQNGQLQRYILYGIIFITCVICVPMFIDKILTIVNFLNNL